MLQTLKVRFVRAAWVVWFCVLFCIHELPKVSHTFFLFPELFYIFPSTGALTHLATPQESPPTTGSDSPPTTGRDANASTKEEVETGEGGGGVDDAWALIPEQKEPEEVALSHAVSPPKESRSAGIKTAGDKIPVRRLSSRLESEGGDTEFSF